MSIAAALPPQVPPWIEDLLAPRPPEAIALHVGGVLVTVALALAAARHLERSPGLMVRQPLAAIGHPLAACDYHAEAAPYRAQFWARLTFRGKGAAGRPATKAAFIYALDVRSAQARREAVLAAATPLLEGAYSAFGSDFTYVVSMAEAAVTHLAREHSWRLRSQLRAAQQQAVAQCLRQGGEFTCNAKSACGTGECRFASGVMASLGAAAGPGRLQRPPNHADRAGYSAAPALEELERVVPFRVRPE